MRAFLMRAGSMPIHQRFVSGSSKTSISRHNSFGESFSGHGDRSASRISLNVRSSDQSPATHVGMRRAFSESDVIISERMPRSSAGFKPSPARISEEAADVPYGWGSLILKESGIPVEEMGLSGGGSGRGPGDSGSSGNSSRGGDYNDRSKIGEYYREMLKSNPNSSLLLMNYGRFLYEVEKDAERAEEYYGRAIMERPGDGEALTMYGKLIWETERDEERAKGYFDQAVNASPDDCMVLGSYAHFMWEADDDDDDDDDGFPALSPAMVSAAV
ncbi:PREDICTED: uncharacterized protein LOC104806719 [Tarenaya hassleriana]|uniref:uncharacterized protein LOC104806719 n=1 Tax=Tarenaya hassleriana TaxID=28532 RepID=UPI00053C3127|nr:PREDICTED: uncharacterized protein LOC104806719 [Tarenaya hassleriana]